MAPAFPDGTFGMFRLAHAVCLLMDERGTGTLLVTSAPSRVGNAGQQMPPATMGGRRALCQTLNAEYGSKSVPAHIVVDGCGRRARHPRQDARIRALSAVTRSPQHGARRPDTASKDRGPLLARRAAARI